jgi:hypothetical protein
MIVLGESENIGEEAVVTYFKALFQNLPGWAEENLSQDNWCPSRTSVFPNTGQSHWQLNQLAELYKVVGLIIYN